MVLVRSFRVRAFAAAALMGLAAGGSIAADATPAPAIAAADLGVPAQECETCSADPAGRKPFFMGKLHTPLHTKKITVPHLCPGACFGYFQTKWNRWEDVCGHYYQGVNLSDAPKAPIPGLTQPGGMTRPGVTAPGANPGTTPMPMPDPKRPMGDPLPTPKTVIPMPMGGTPFVPPVPAPGSKFAQ